MTATPITPKGIKTRQRTLEAARAAFSSDGYVRVTMVDVAERADLSLGGLYRYFQCKDDLFESLVEDIHAELMRASQPSEHHLAEEPYQALLEANLGYLRHYYANRDVMRAFIEAANVMPRFRTLWWQMREHHRDRFLHASSRDGVKPVLEGAEAKAAAEAMTCMVEQTAFVWYAHESIHDFEVDLDAAARVLTRAWCRLFFDHPIPPPASREEDPR